VDDETRAFDMPEELLAEACAFARALDQAGNVSDHELAVIEASHAQVRREGRERIVRDLRPRARQRREQARLAGVRQAGETNVGDEAELELELALLAGLAVLGDARHAPGARREARVAAAALSAARDDDLLTRRDEIGDDLSGRDVLHRRARRHLEGEIAARFPGFVRPTAGAATRRGVRLSVAIVTEGGELIIDAEDDVAASSAVAAIRSAARDMRLAAERDHAFAAVPAADQHTRAIEEHLDPRERPHERADAKMRQLLAQALERARDTDRRFARFHQRERAERVGREVAQQDRASLP